MMNKEDAVTLLLCIIIIVLSVNTFFYFTRYKSLESKIEQLKIEAVKLDYAEYIIEETTDSKYDTLYNQKWQWKNNNK